MATRNLGFSANSINDNNWANGWMTTVSLSAGDTKYIGTVTIDGTQLAEIPDGTIIQGISLKGLGNTNLATNEGQIIAKIYYNSGSSKVEIGAGSCSKFNNTSENEKVISLGSCNCADLKNNSYIEVSYKNCNSLVSGKISYRPTAIIVEYTYSLDMNGSLDGVERGDIGGLGTATVVVGENTTTGATDYWNTDLEPNTEYSISNIQAASDYYYTGSESHSGTLTKSTKVVLPFITKVPYTVNYEGNGCTNSISPPSSTGRIGENYTIIQNPGFIKEYTVVFNFNGSGVANQSAISAATMNGWEDWGTITASNGEVFTPEQFDAPFYANNNSDLYNVFQYNKLSLVNHYVNIGRAEGRRATSIDGVRGIYPQSSTAVSLADNGGSTTLKAQWSEMSAITLISPTRDGYTFIGWYTSASGGEKVGDGGDLYTPNSNITLYAHWQCTITYDGNGATNKTTESVSVIDGESISLSNNFEKIYWVLFKDADGQQTFAYMTSEAEFLGWYTDKVNGEKVGDDKGIYVPSGDTTLYARWSNMPAIIMPVPPARESYTFMGYWNTSNPNQATVKYGDAGDSYVPTKGTTVCISLWVPKRMINLNKKQVNEMYLYNKRIKYIYRGREIIFYDPN